MEQARILKPNDDLAELGDPGINLSGLDQPVTTDHSCGRSIEGNRCERERFFTVSQPPIRVALLNAGAPCAPQTGHFEPKVVEDCSVFERAAAVRKARLP